LNTCCVEITCGNSFPADGCGAWDTPASAQTHCISGKCDKDICCIKDPKVICKVKCNAENIKSIDPVTPPAPGQSLVAAARVHCDSAANRSKCFGVLDLNGDGNHFSYCLRL
jgi:hypothetical protein